MADAKYIYMTTFKELGLSGETLKGVVSAGYTSPTPIQTEAIPIARSGRDLIGCAQTGTGKTAAFVLPMLQRLSEAERPGKGRKVRALVVTPTRELALQVEAAIRTYGAYTRFQSVAVYGGVGMGPQIQKLRRGVDIIVATPGRLLDHIQRRNIDLSFVEMLVLDEADRMLDMGFINDIRKIVSDTPDDRQTVLFSATMPKEIQALTKSIQKNPAFIQIGKVTNPAETVIQKVCMVKSSSKMELLSHVLENEPAQNVIVFSRTKHRADRIVKRLGQEGFSATVMHSNRSQAQRQKALRGFRNGTFQILVATDIAARGIDVDSISHVINFDTPAQAEDYIHRIGRTGRAETTGEAITFVAKEEVRYLRDIERHTGQKLERRVYDGFEVDQSATESYDSQKGHSGGGNYGGAKSKRNGNKKPYGRSRSTSSGSGRPKRGSNGAHRSGSDQRSESGSESTSSGGTYSRSNGGSSRAKSSGTSSRPGGGKSRSYRGDSRRPGGSTRGSAPRSGDTRSSSRSSSADSGSGRASATSSSSSSGGRSRTGGGNGRGSGTGRAWAKTQRTNSGGRSGGRGRNRPR